MNIQTGESPEARAPSTNFSVVRVSRDFLRRSRVGAIATRRDPIAATLPGKSGDANLAYGVDTLINPTNEVSISSYLAKTTSPGRHGDDLSYRGRLDWNADRYGIQAEYLGVDPNFNPEVGFLRRSSFRRSFGQTRYSPRPGWRGIRKVYYIGSIDYITDIRYVPESKELQGTYQMDLENSDVWSADVTRNYERLISRFEVAQNVFVPLGEYSFDQVRGTSPWDRSGRSPDRLPPPTAVSTTGRCRSSPGAAARIFHASSTLNRPSPGTMSPIRPAMATAIF